MELIATGDVGEGTRRTSGRQAEGNAGSFRATLNKLPRIAVQYVSFARTWFELPGRRQSGTLEPAADEPLAHQFDVQ